MFSDMLLMSARWLLPGGWSIDAIEVTSCHDPVVTEWPEVGVRGEYRGDPCVFSCGLVGHYILDRELQNCTERLFCQGVGRHALRRRERGKSVCSQEISLQRSAAVMSRPFCSAKQRSLLNMSS